ncbi:MAG: hypothetical protein Ta2A_20950 [Treponemataceae bacterium]|nr:MAG: hypothetical protein Ta2A_20950 [Treponemataceae bacterium]
MRNFPRPKPLQHAAGFAFLFCAFSFLFIAQSCSPQVSFVVADNGHTTCDFSVTLDSDTRTLLAYLYAADGGEAKDPDALALFDTKTIQNAFVKSGFSDVRVGTNRNSSLSVHFASSNVNDIFFRIPSATYDEANGVKRLRWLISPDTAKLLLDIFPEDSSGYMALFMAPILTDERMSADEYIELISGVYGNAAGALLKKSAFKMTFTLPGPVVVRAVPKGVSTDVNGKTVTISMPLAELLCVTGRFSFEIQWT